MWQTMVRECYGLVSTWWNQDRIRTNSPLSQLATLQVGDAIQYKDSNYLVTSAEVTLDEESMALKIVRLMCREDLSLPSISIGIIAITNAETRMIAFVSNRSHVDWLHVAQESSRRNREGVLDGSFEEAEPLFAEEFMILPRRIAKTYAVL